jgi:hypothetical protein
MLEISNANFKKFANENKAFCDAIFTMPVKHDPRPFWYDTTKGKQVRFTNPKQFRKYLADNSLGHCNERGRQLFYLPQVGAAKQSLQLTELLNHSPLTMKELEENYRVGLAEMNC